MQANLIDCVSHMFFRSDKQFVLTWSQFGVKTHIVILLKPILKFTFIMAAIALKVLAYSCTSRFYIAVNPGSIHEL